MAEVGEGKLWSRHLIAADPVSLGPPLLQTGPIVPSGEGLDCTLHLALDSGTTQRCHRARGPVGNFISTMPQSLRLLSEGSNPFGIGGFDETTSGRLLALSRCPVGPRDRAASLSFHASCSANFCQH